MSEDGGPRMDEDRRRGIEAAERVAAGLVHEFRNVLNPIVSAAWLLEANAGDPAKVIELAHRIDGFAKADSRIAAKIRELIEREATGEQVQSPTQDDSRSASSTSKA
jgi:nitrogen-specific signal transduction histidine kinase